MLLKTYTNKNTALSDQQTNNNLIQQQNGLKHEIAYSCLFVLYMWYIIMFNNNRLGQISSLVLHKTAKGYNKNLYFLFLSGFHLNFNMEKFIF